MRKVLCSTAEAAILPVLVFRSPSFKRRLQSPDHPLLIFVADFKTSGLELTTCSRRVAPLKGKVPLRFLTCIWTGERPLAITGSVKKFLTLTIKILQVRKLPEISSIGPKALLPSGIRRILMCWTLWKMFAKQINMIYEIPAIVCCRQTIHKGQLIPEPWPVGRKFMLGKVQINVWMQIIGRTWCKYFLSNPPSDLGR